MTACLCRKIRKECIYKDYRIKGLATAEQQRATPQLLQE
jgi:hypothetical protein